MHIGNIDEMRMDTATLERLLTRWLPPVDRHGFRVLEIGPQAVTLEVDVPDSWLSHDLPHGIPNPIVSGPMMMGFADTALYAAIHAHYGSDVIARLHQPHVTAPGTASAGPLRADAAKHHASGKPNAARAENTASVVHTGGV